MRHLSLSQERVLWAIITLGENAYGVAIKQFLEQEISETVSYGALYTTLDRLEKRGFVSSRQGGATPTRGGRAKRYFKIEALGSKALNETHDARTKLFARLDPALV